MLTFFCVLLVAENRSEICIKKNKLMIFSLEKWNNAVEIRPFVSVAKSTTFATLEAPLRNAFENFIRPTLGEALTAKLIEYYTGNTTDPKQKRFIELAQAACAFLAFWSEYDEMQLLIDDSGSHRQESEKQKTPYKYQEQRIRENWRQKGFNTIDKLLEFLESNAGDFAEFAQSPNYTLLKTQIVRSTKEVNDCYWINNSRILFLRLRPHFKTVTDTIVAPRMGAIYTDMIEKLAATDTPEADKKKYNKLREMLVPVVVFYAVSRLLKESGSLTERGLFFETFQHPADDFNTDPVSMAAIAPQAAMAEGDAISYWGLAEKHMKVNFAYTPAQSGRLPKFDNTGKKYFVV